MNWLEHICAYVFIYIYIYIYIYIHICFCVENITQQKVGFDYVISITLRILTLSIKVGRKGYFMKGFLLVKQIAVT
jgi:hypothetical protein